VYATSSSSLENWQCPCVSVCVSVSQCLCVLRGFAQKTNILSRSYRCSSRRIELRRCTSIVLLRVIRVAVYRTYLEVPVSGVLRRESVCRCVWVLLVSGHAARKFALVYVCSIVPTSLFEDGNTYEDKSPREKCVPQFLDVRVFF